MVIVMKRNELASLRTMKPEIDMISKCTLRSNVTLFAGWTGVSCTDIIKVTCYEEYRMAS